MKSKRPQIAILVTTAIVSLAGSSSRAGNETSKFIPLEDLSAPDRNVIQQYIEANHLDQTVDWDNNIVGLNEEGKIEIRDRSTHILQMVANPTCVGGGI